MSDHGAPAQATTDTPSRRPDAQFASRSSFVFGREVSFFDAVYGFAATLLISNVDAPPADAWHSVDALLASGAGSQTLGFALSFTVIVVLWRVNVRLTRRMTGLDGPSTVANLFAAASVVMIAFTTQGISDPHSADLPLPTALYAANIALACLCQLATFQLARARGLERSPSGMRENLLDVLAGAVTPIVFILSIPIAFWAGAQAAKWVWLSLVVVSPLVGVLAGRAAQPSRLPSSVHAGAMASSDESGAEPALGESDPSPPGPLTGERGSA